MLKLRFYDSSDEERAEGRSQLCSRIHMHVERNTAVSRLYSPRDVKQVYFLPWKSTPWSTIKDILIYDNTFCDYIDPSRMSRKLGPAMWGNN